ncbi:hypothetical protein NA57DRAFT_77757 [Rhizodiscina lignyota]|uniref:Uncharacterized protein n=1 Tax=Rhizodiscina lignyota TaxID=1504668 RepID=A0A9P4IDZ2_9PEZI|nr:hypothetical protein NA57DRAFT_77757 [Rhizodiscina lignyota]
MAEWNGPFAAAKPIDLSSSLLVIRHMEQQDHADSNRTKEIFGNLILQSAQNVRFMHIGMGAFSIVLALVIIARIFYDSWRASQLQVRLRPKPFSWITDLHPAEVFPLALSITTIVQQTIFIILQSFAINSITVNGCDKTVQLVFPTIFLLGFMHLVFGAEFTIRGFQSQRFGPRKPWTTQICIAVFCLLVLFTWLPTNLHKTRPKCFGDMIMRPIIYSPIALAIMTTLIAAFMVMAIIIGMRLVRTVNIDPNERIAASRIFYYLLASIALHILILPFFIQAILRDFDKNLSSSRVAEITLFGQGIIISLIHIFLRTNALRTAIRPIQAAWSPTRKFRLFGPSDLEIVNISPPVNLLGPREAEYYWNENEKSNTPREFRFPDEKTPFQTEDLYTIPRSGDEQTRWPLPADPLPTPRTPAPASISSPTQPSMTTANHRRKPTNYSLFPSEAEDGPRLPAAVYSPTSSAAEKSRTPDSPRQPVQVDRSISTILDSYRASSIASPTSAGPEPLTLLQPTTYTPVESRRPQATDPLFLQPPAPSFSFPSHRRGSSASSSATVQIGLRLSMAPSAIAAPATASMISTSAGPSGLRHAMTPPAEEPEGSSTVNTPAATSVPEEFQMLESPAKLLQQMQQTRQQTAALSESTSQNYSKPTDDTGYFPALAPIKTDTPLWTEKELPPTPRRGISGLALNPITPDSPKPSPAIGVALSSRPSSKAQSPGPGFF